VIRTINSQYAHRVNKDGSHDSICLTCFATVTSATSEDALIKGENDHPSSHSTRQRPGITPHGAPPNSESSSL
jgi:hypothetical protein